MDRTTGDIALLRYIAVHDSGPLMNPMLVEGQIQGGVVQGIGQALSEAMLYSDQGQVQTGSFMDYAAPYAPGLPALVVDTVSTPSASNPLGVRGIGEAPSVAAPAAIANAVHDALASEGVRHIDIPLTPGEGLEGNRAGPPRVRRLMECRAFEWGAARWSGRRGLTQGRRYRPAIARVRESWAC